MPLTFAEVNKDYKVKLIRGRDSVKNRLKKLGIVEGIVIRNLANNGAGFIVKVDECRIALDNLLANRIIVEE